MKSYRHPDAHWFGSPNRTVDRDGHDMAIPPAYVVLHTMVGTVIGANARFQQPAEQASATYGIGLDGSLYQWVDEKDGAWANGTFEDNPGANMDSISIEHEDNGDFNGPRTPQLYAASAQLVHDICTRYGIPIDRQHVLGHRECIHAVTACPDALDVDRIVREAAGSGGDIDMATADEIMKKLGEVQQSVNDQWSAAFDGFGSNTPRPPFLRGEVENIQKTLDKMGSTTTTTGTGSVQVDATAVAKALAANQDFLNAVAAAVVKLEGAKLSS